MEACVCNCCQGLGCFVSVCGAYLLLASVGSFSSMTAIATNLPVVKERVLERPARETEEEEDEKDNGTEIKGYGGGRD